MKKISSFLIITAILLLFAATASADKTFLSGYTQILYNASSKMEANDANDVLQTRDGYLWIASYKGLIRYDGDTFTLYNRETSNGFTASSATTLYEDAKGRLWIGTNESGLFCLEEGKFRKIPDLSGGGFSIVRSVVCDSKGNLFVGASSGIGQLTAAGIERIELGNRNTAFVLKIICDKEDNIWVVTRVGEVFTVENGKIEHVFNEKEMLGHSASSLLCRSDGAVVVGMSAGGIVSFVKNKAYYLTEYHSSSPLIAINSLYEDSKGRIWACGDNGLGYYDEKGKFNDVEGCLMGSSIVNVIEDYEGSFWIASSRQGLLQISKNKFTDINFAASLPRSVVNSTLKHAGFLYVGTDRGLYSFDKKWQRELSLTNTKFDGARVRNLMADSNGILWVSMFNRGGIASISPDGKIKVYGKTEGLPNDNVRLSLELLNGDIAVATNSGLGIIRNGKVIKTYTEKDGMSNPTILSMCEDDKGNLYLGSDGDGIFSIKNGYLKNEFKKIGSSGVIMRLLFDKENGGIWISTGQTLDFFSSAGIRQIPFKGRIGAGIYDIKKGINGELILLAETGVHFAKTKKLLQDKNPTITSYTNREGLSSSITANSWSYMEHSGQIYLSCVNGVYSINISDVFINKSNPKISIKNAEVDGENYENPQKLVMKSDAKRLTLDLAVLSFVNPGYNKVEYSLEGFDKENTVLLMKDFKSITYTNLKGGLYTFLFNALNSDGTQNKQPITLAIEKEKTLMEQPIFILLLLVCGGGTVFSVTRFYYRIKEKKLLERQEELREITSQAITAIANTIDAKDAYTKGHSSRVADFSVLIAEKMGYGTKMLDNLYYTALLHDIGKIGIPDRILNKDGKLTDEEYEIIKQHPAIGANILKTITVIPEIKEGAAFHHEKFDGSGYNNGFKGDEIPITARIIGVADSFDAMASTRPYRKCRTKEYVISEIERFSGIQFDPQIAKILIDLIKTDKIQIECDTQFLEKEQLNESK